MIQELKYDQIVIGSGAAGFSSALRLYKLGEKNIAIITDNVESGTSRNTGSDKQTYYKLSLAGPDSDSVLNMAQDLYAGGAVDGDMALCEAALSVRGFYNLVELGVPFPDTCYGEYMGYKTDHDRGRRATSAGPYTSKMMTEALEKEVNRDGIQILDGYQAIKILTENNRVYGVLCLNRTQGDYTIIWADSVILATGGPSGMYHDSVYPESQLGRSGMAFAAGVSGKNLTEWQFGIASIHPRWNVSGSYMQVLPRFISTDPDGNDEQEFLLDYFENREQMLSMVFLKGYQWPFDVNKIFGGSSFIDLLVYQETVLRGRRVFLDFRTNSCNTDIHFEDLSEEAYLYLKNAGALQQSPIERLEQLNLPAVTFYMDHKIDLHKEPIEIAVCVQHNNGGLSTNADWETEVHGLYAVGELNGSHGITRPGGTALNAGQTGAIRAAESIHLRKLSKQAASENDGQALEKIHGHLREQAAAYSLLPSAAHGSVKPSELWKEASERMSAYGGMIRNMQTISEALQETSETLSNLNSVVRKPSTGELSLYFRLIDMLTSQKVYLSAMANYIKYGAGSRGSALYTNQSGKKPSDKLPEAFRCVLDTGMHSDVIQEVKLSETGTVAFNWRPVRKIPSEDYFFENQWKLYRQRNRLE